MPSIDDVIGAVKAELERATAKFPTWPTDPLHALAVLGEEYGELTRAMLQVTYEPVKATAADVREEAIQTAAMALRLAMSLDRYEYRRCHQHTQDATCTTRIGSEGDRYVGMTVAELHAEIAKQRDDAAEPPAESAVTSGIAHPDGWVFVDARRPDNVWGFNGDSVTGMGCGIDAQRPFHTFAQALQHAGACIYGISEVRPWRLGDSVPPMPKLATL